MAMKMTLEDFEYRLAAILQDHGGDMTAEITNCLVAYWDGHAVTYVIAYETSSGVGNKKFDVNGCPWEEWRPTFEAWLEQPVFSLRSEVREWLAEAPPLEPDA
jgi:hypothetical protein